MRKKPYCVYIFTRSKLRQSDLLTRGDLRFCRLRVEAKAGKKRLFATLPATFFGDEFQKVFNSDGSLKPGIKPRDPLAKIQARQAKLAYQTACEVTESLIKNGKFDTLTSAEFSEIVADEFKRKGGVELDCWDYIKSENGEGGANK